MKICCAGEVMVELARQQHTAVYQQDFAGDSYNTAVYLARAGLQVDYLTRLGDDSFSETILQRLRDEDIGDRLIQLCPGRQPGLYLIDNDDNGERQFTYWREHSPAREMFDDPLSLASCDMFYLTGITLAITRSDIDNLVALLGELRQTGCTIVFDPNYRPGLWQDRKEAQSFYRQVLPLCDILLTALEDETALWETDSVEACHLMYRQFELRELVIKTQDLTTHVFYGEQHFLQQATAVGAVDTTGAGDSFNAGYLAARLQGQSIEEAVGRAQMLSAAVIQQRGAIVARDETIVTGSK
jgi:2-dehydro-3-deoxygluconokinase